MSMKKNGSIKNTEYQFYKKKRKPVKEKPLSLEEYMVGKYVQKVFHK